MNNVIEIQSSGSLKNRRISQKFTTIRNLKLQISEDFGMRFGGALRARVEAREKAVGRPLACEQLQEVQEAVASM